MDFELSDWEFDVLGIYNFRKPGKLQALFDLMKMRKKEPMNYFEAGVFRGRTLLAVAIFMKLNQIEGKVFGFDSFCGFPSVSHENDALHNFQKLHQIGEITQRHLDMHLRLVELRKMVHKTETIDLVNIASSLDFSSSSLDDLNEKIKFLNLDNIEIIEGPFEDTMRGVAERDIKFHFGNIDCDLYPGYSETLEMLKRCSAENCCVHLDEYFSLKYPGARIACNEFIESVGSEWELKCVSQEPGEFERWLLVKNS